MRKMMLVLSVFVTMGMVLSAEVRFGERPFIDIYKVPDSAIEFGHIRIKLSENNSLLAQAFSYRNGVLDVFQIEELDALNQKYGVTRITPVFGETANNRKWGWRHIEWGLHLWFELEYDSAADIRDIVMAYRDLKNNVQWAEPEYKKRLCGVGDNQKSETPESLNRWTPNDPYYSSQWHYHNTGQVDGTADCDIDLPEAWEVEKGHPDVIVAVIDGGIQITHPDLNNNIWSGVGYNFVTNNSTINPEDHGTHVAGTIAAENNNSTGVSGIAGGNGTTKGVSLMSCQVFDGNDQGGFDAAPVWAADNGAAISQNSWAYQNPDVYNQTDLDAIDYFNTHGGGSVLDGGITIFAAGNDEAEGNYYPGCYDGAFSVAATNNKDIKSSYSNWGTWVDISAPGGETYYYDDPRGVRSTISGDSYYFYQGTSMACPHVSGVAALVVSCAYRNNILLTNTQLASILQISSDDHYAVNQSYIGKLGSGRLNAYQALLQIQDPAVITWDPTSLYQELPLNATDSQNLTIGNTGEMVLNYTLSKESTPATFPIDGFEDYANFAISFAPWTLADVDLSTTYGMTGITWSNAYAAMAYMIFVPSATTPPVTDAEPHSGLKQAACFASTMPPNDDWLISPLITPVSGDLLEFYAKSYTSQYGLERFKVGISSGGTAPGDFTIISGANYIEAPVEWTYYYYDLSSYAGQNIRFAIQCLSNDAFIFFLDDVSVSSGESYTPSWLTLNSGNTVTGTVDGVAKDTDVIAVGFNSTGLAAGTYTTSLSLTSNSGSNPSISIPVTLQVEEPLPVQLSSFTAAISADNYVNLTWVTQTETGVQGFYVLRNSNEELATATTVSELIQATNTSQQQTYIFTDAELQEDGTYYYWLQNSDLDGTVDFHGPISIAYAIVGGGIPSIPLVTSLAPAYPNPFNPSTTLSYSLAEPAPVVIDIYNQRGQIVRSYHKEHSAPGQFSLAFDGRDRNGVPLSSGVYLYRMSAGTFSQFRKMVLCK